MTSIKPFPSGAQLNSEKLHAQLSMQSKKVCDEEGAMSRYYVTGDTKSGKGC